MKLDNFMLIFTKQTGQFKGSWFGRVITAPPETIKTEFVLDKHGNDIDCLLANPNKCAESLIKQLKENKLI